MARLILKPGKQDQQVFELKPGSNTIGRTKNNDVYMLHKSMSRNHARIAIEGDRITVEDLGSKNGVFVDGERVKKKALGPSHWIKFGDLQFACVVEGAALPTASAAAPAATALPPTATPSIIYDQTRDPLRRSLHQMLTMSGGGKKISPSKTALNLQAPTQAERNQEKLQILLKVSELLSSPAAIDDVLARILELAFEILDVDRGTVVMCDDGTPVPRVHKVRPGRPDDETFSTQIVAWVLDRGVAGLFADTRHDERIKADGSIIAQSIWSAMCTPLKVGDKLLGAIYVDNVTRPNRFQEEDLEFLSAFANQAAIAIDNATLQNKLADEAVTRNNLMRFFPPTAIDSIVQSADTLGARETQATALFCDISGYTAMSSTMTPMEVIQLLNAYFPPMAQIVFRHEGTLEKYIGDALLAVWGAPFSHDDDAERAVRAAADMQVAMRELTSSGRLPPGLAIHIGVNTGIVAAGNIGSEHYLQYATIGDATNVASRICGVATDGQIVIDRLTAEALSPGAFQLTALEPVKVKGKAEPLSLYRVEWS
ncbi:MAG: GAF domain-containing protein [Deltaproteobacteria bacterium]|nr:GAF domain-containing protein [Deltaproteobacteria bacterium]MBW2530941.1 GAF domain-containing protein [Deltaproteobacteria bacterium]